MRSSMLFAGLGVLLAALGTLALAESDQSSATVPTTATVPTAESPTEPPAAADAKPTKSEKGPAKSDKNSSEKNKENRKPSGKSDSRKVKGFTEEREAAAMTFARANHPELADLLEQLKQTDTTQYQQAIRDLFRSSEKLALAQEKNPLEYELELELWRLRSRSQLLVAQLTMGPDPAIENQLRAAIAEQFKLRKLRLTHDRERLEARLADIKREMQKLDAEPSRMVDERMQEMLSHARNSRASLKASSESGKNASAGATAEADAERTLKKP